jgi:phosphatidylserine synthase
MSARWNRRLADGLTVGRAVIGLPLILALIADQTLLAWCLLLIGGLSDAADGWLARRAGGGSVWGARLDPLTDKILISAPLLWLRGAVAAALALSPGGRAPAGVGLAAVLAFAAAGPQLRLGLPAPSLKPAAPSEQGRIAAEVGGRGHA